MTKPLLSIALCCYNDAPYLELLFHSLYSNTKGPFEICVIDNASCDATPRLLHDYSKCYDNFFYRSNACNVGVIGVNDAVKMSRGQYIIDANSDMIFAMSAWDVKLLQYLQLLEKANEGLASVSAILVEPYPNDEYYCVDLGKTPQEVHLETMERVMAETIGTGIKKSTVQFSHPIMMSRATWDQVGGISAEFPWPGYATDVDLGYKLLSRGAYTVMCSDVGVYHFSSATLRSLKQELGHDLPPGEQEFRQKNGLSIRAFYAKHGVRLPFDWQKKVFDRQAQV